MNVDTGIGALITAFITAMALAINQVFGKPSERMAHELAREKLEADFAAASLARIKALEERADRQSDKVTELEASLRKALSSSAADAAHIARLETQIEDRDQRIAALEARVAELEDQLDRKPAAATKKRKRKS